MENFHKPDIVIKSENIYVNSKGQPVEETSGDTVFAR